MDWFVKAILFLIFAPVLACIALQITVAVLQTLLPWLILLALIAGAAAGIGAGFSIRRRLPPQNGRLYPPQGTPPLMPYRVRRPRRGARR
jgi:hypothetical protein